MILARADRELREDVAVAKRLGLDLDGLIEAAEGCTERLCWTVSDPRQYRVGWPGALQPPAPADSRALSGGDTTELDLESAVTEARAPRRPLLVGWCRVLYGTRVSTEAPQAGAPGGRWHDRRLTDWRHAPLRLAYECYGRHAA